jgi:ribonuclease BN (tRNA processing enzyme)
LVDLGPGALQHLCKAGASYKEIASVFLSHTHPDHISSLLPLLQALNFTPGFTRSKPLFIYGSPEVQRFLECNLALNPCVRPNFPMHFITLSDGKEIVQEGWCMLPRQVAHSMGTFGFRFTVGQCTLVYGADTGPCDEIVDLAQDADLVILECSFRHHNQSPGHLTTFQAGKIATVARARRLLLTHFYPQVIETPKAEREAEVRMSGYTGEVIFAEDLMEVKVYGD